MSQIKTIKGVADNVWSDFKSLAAKYNKNMGDFFGDVIEIYKENENKDVWKEILYGEKVLSDKDANSIKTRINEFRKNSGSLRKIKWE